MRSKKIKKAQLAQAQLDQAAAIGAAFIREQLNRRSIWAYVLETTGTFTDVDGVVHKIGKWNDTGERVAFCTSEQSLGDVEVGQLPPTCLLCLGG